MGGKSDKTCFVIAPIGPPDSDIRKYSDKVLNFVIKLQLTPLGYKVIRADEISEPGSINAQIIRQLINADVVLADLTGQNPNVMYELAIRHVIRKPVILIAKKGEILPFDIINERTIIFDITDIADVEQAKKCLVDQVHAIEKNKFTESPFSITESVLIPTHQQASVDNRLLTISDDVRYIKGILKIKMDSFTTATMKNAGQDWQSDVTIKEQWMKIRIEYPTLSNRMESTNLEISTEETIFSVLSTIWSFLNAQKDSKLKPKAYTYLWDWLLIKKKNGMPLLVKGIMDNIPASAVFRNGEIWKVEGLSKPLLYNPERYRIHKGKSDNW